MTAEEIRQEIKKLKKRKAMFAERYIDKIRELDEEIERLRTMKTTPAGKIAAGGENANKKRREGMA